MKRKPRVSLLHIDSAQETGRKAERKTARRLGAALHAASGALNQRGDMSTLQYVVENKSTQKESVRIGYDWLRAVCVAAREQNKEPALSLQFTSGSGQPRPQGRWVLIREDLFTDLLSDSE